MNNEEPYRDQAERLKQRIEKINEKIEDKDVLPPREQIHRQKKKKTKWKLKYPLIRLLVLFFILLPIIIFSVISYQDGAKTVNGIEKSTKDNVGYETINLEKSKEDDETNLEKSDESQEIIIENSDSEEPGEESQNSVEQKPEENVNTSVQTPSTNENKTDTQVDKNSEQVIVTETPETKETPGSTETTETSTESKIKYHTVKPNENLYRLAMTYYNSPKGMDIIMIANNLNSNQISAGQVLKIPPNN
jgi:LysM repeat protein